MSTSAAEYFVRSFDVFKQKANQHRENVRTFQDYLPSVVQRVMPSFAIEQRTQFNILSIGGGSGEIDMEIVKIIQRELRKQSGCQHVNIFNRAIEPNECSSKLYKEAVEKSKDPHVTFDIRQQTFQEYQGSAKEPLSFDIVHFIHSLYHVDVEQTVLYCFEKELNQNGHFICLLGDNQSINKTIFKRLHRLHNASTQVNDDEPKPKNYEKSRELKTIAQKHGLKHELHSQQLLVDVTEVFDAKSVDGNLLLDFLTASENFRKTSDQQRLEETLVLIEELTVVKEGKRVGEIKESLIFIYK